MQRTFDLFVVNIQVRNDISDYVYGRTLHMEQRAAMLSEMKIKNLATPQAIVDRIHRSSRPDVSMDTVNNLAMKCNINIRGIEVDMANDIEGEQTQTSEGERTQEEEMVTDKPDTTTNTTATQNGTSEPEISKP